MKKLGRKDLAIATLIKVASPSDLELNNVADPAEKFQVRPHQSY
jgi:hypothetical protein